MVDMDAIRLGLSIRAMRRRRGWTQRELGRRVVFSASEISRIERGGAGRVSLRRLEQVLEALGARLYVRATWQGEELDRLLDRDHANIVEAVLRILAGDGWVAAPEATFQIGGERGSIDILASHEPTGALLVVEVKSVVPDVQATLGGLDRKARLAPAVAEGRGWPVGNVGRVLVLPDNRTARRRVDQFRGTFDRALPSRTAAVKRWFRDPAEPLSGLMFLSSLASAQARHRVRARPWSGTLGCSLRE